MNFKKIREELDSQFHSNILAIISLAFAVAGIIYSAHREAIDQENHVVRTAGFEVLKNLGELQRVVDFAHYEKDKGRGDPISGWGYVLLVKDLTQIMPAPVSGSGEKLFQTWQADWAGIENDEQSVNRITAQIKSAREVVLQSLKMLH